MYFAVFPIEFDDLLAAEYDASFPETFKSCWERIIDEVGLKSRESLWSDSRFLNSTEKKPLLRWRF